MYVFLGAIHQKLKMKILKMISSAINSNRVELLLRNVDLMQKKINVAGCLAAVGGEALVVIFCCIIDKFARKDDILKRL